MFKKKWMRFLLLMTMPTMLTGCWDSVEVNRRSIMLEFAIDKTEDYTPNPKKLLDDQGIYTVTYSIPDFGKLSGTESLAKNMETKIVVQAPTIQASMDDLETRNKNSVTFGHVKALFLGDELLKDGPLLKRTMDAISRDMLIARNVPILAVNGKAELTADMENTEQPILGLYIMDYFNNQERMSLFFEKQLMGNFIKEMEETGVSTLPVFHVDPVKIENGEVDISGGVVLHDYQYVDTLTKEEVRGQLLMQGKAHNVPVVANYKGSLVTYQIREQKSKISFEQTDEGPTCLVEIKVVGDLLEYLSDENHKVTDTEVVEGIKQAIADEIINQIQVAVDKSKSINIDYLGLGEEFYREDPKVWKTYKARWLEDVYQNMPIAIGVKVNIQSTGIQE